MLRLLNLSIYHLNRKRSRLDSPPAQPPPKSRKRGRGATGPRRAVDLDEEDDDDDDDDPLTTTVAAGTTGSSMKECRDILKELFSKRHTAYAWPFYKPVDTSIFKDYRYAGQFLLLTRFSSSHVISPVRKFDSRVTKSTHFICQRRFRLTFFKRQKSRKETNIAQNVTIQQSLFVS